MKYALLTVLALAGCFCMTANGADPDASAVFTVTDRVLRPAAQVPPLGANAWGRIGAIEWAANNFIYHAGNEPVYWQNMHRVTKTEDNWFEIDGPGTSWWELWANGFLSGARVRIYRIVDAAGDPLPQDGNYIDMTNADHVIHVGDAQVLPEGSPGHPAGGWAVTTYGDVYPIKYTRHGNLSVTDFNAVENGRTYWYRVCAVNSADENGTFSAEVSATPSADGAAGPRMVIASDGDNLPDCNVGSGFSFTPRLVGGTAPFAWGFTGPGGVALDPPAGLAFDTATGTLSGTPTAAVSDFAFELRVVDARGGTDTRRYVINASTPAAGEAPMPPTNLRAEAGDGFVTVSWDASPSDNVAAYRIYRAEAPEAEGVERVYLAGGHPTLAPLDYVVVEKRWENFDMRGVHPRVRGIGNPADAPNWYWQMDEARVACSFAPHAGTVPAQMVDPGETCMRADVAEGEGLLHLYTFIGTDIDGENLWYGYLEPGRSYRAEIWMRQDGLSNGGNVRFRFQTGWGGDPYPGVEADWTATGEWQRFTCDFTAPAGDPPSGIWHYGPALLFEGPGTLYFDNFRVFRCDDAAAREALYTPNPTVMEELLAMQPATGGKGAHRTWYLTRDATMDHILSWHANSQVRPNWQTSVSGTMDMTLPMGLSFDLHTGDTAETRMRPWLVLQHLVHDEQDWLNFVEYLAAPYDPATDTPETKPYAYRRYQQRGVATPWTDEFAEIMVEFGNETWHNGVFEDWLGFHLNGWVHQGGREYGLFAQYLIEVMKSSPYWASEGLEDKIRFVLGGNYDGDVDGEGNVSGYAELAMTKAPGATDAGHANYIGPKWETGDVSQATFDDHGVQETLLAFLTNVEANQQKMGDARDYFAEHYHAYDIVAYEGGPSGYALPGQASAEQVETNERYGKSLAMAVSSLDGWMRSYTQGWTDQCFFSYGQGSHWNSHTVMLNGFRPSPGWLAAGLRNRCGAGDLMAVTETAVPTYERSAGEAYPLAGAYAMRDGGTWTVFVVSRKLDGDHDGHDFGDGYTSVTLQLPFDTAESITLHALAGDPRESNRDAMNIAVEAVTIAPETLTDGTFEIEGGMPPGSIHAYVFETASAEGEGEGEGEPSPDLAALLGAFREHDANGDRRLSLAEARTLVPGFTDVTFAAVDVNGDGGMTVAELLEANGPGILHRADTAGDRNIALDELLRVVQVYNAGGCACAATAGSTEDGCLPRAPGAGDPACAPHTADLNGDGTIGLEELLRVVQLMQWGAYVWCPGGGTIDGFCAG